jgi:hypothetical protein
LLAGVLAVLSGVAVFLLASELFPYHSSNHDEAVYLQQAELLLEGQFRLYPGPFGEAVRPWFFVDAGDSFYPKYQPLPAGFYALAMALFGEPRVTLAAIAAGNVALVYTLGAMAFDRRVGLVAAGLFATAPMTLVTSSVFLPYAPTTLFALAFAVAYLHSYRTGRRSSALVAGGTIGVAFFMRPYTAVLFAGPFLLHASWELSGALRRRVADGDGVWPLPVAVRRHGLTAAVGLVFVAATLAYNASVTGSALEFPYEVFAPRDGPGLGEREILDHSVDYTLPVALRSNGAVLWYLLTRWGPAGALGTVFAVGGVLASGAATGLSPFERLRRGSHELLPGSATARGLLAGLFVSVPLGNLFFWGNFNVLATPGDPTDGLLGQFGPFYHFDLLAPLAIFAAAGLVGSWRLGRRLAAERSVASRLPSRTVARAAGLSVLLLGVLVLGAANAALLTGPLDRNAAHTETYEDAYAPFEQREFEDAVVFVPTPYGDWLSHPFQALRNEPGFDGETIYALDRGPESDFAVLEATPNRSHHRFTYRGEWTADPEERVVVPKVERLDVRRGERLVGESTVGVPERVEDASVRLETDDGFANVRVGDPRGNITVGWSMADGTARLESVDESAVNATAVPVEETDEVALQVRLVQSVGATLTYRQETTVRTTGGTVEAVWPPERTVCPLVDDCGREGTYLPTKPERQFDGVRFETSLSGSSGTP